MHSIRGRQLETLLATPRHSDIDWLLSQFVELLKEWFKPRLSQLGSQQQKCGRCTRAFCRLCKMFIATVAFARSSLYMVASNAPQLASETALMSSDPTALRNKREHARNISTAIVTPSNHVCIDSKQDRAEMQQHLQTSPSNPVKKVMKRMEAPVRIAELTLGVDASYTLMQLSGVEK